MNRRLRAAGASGKTSDTDLFGDDPLAAKKSGEPLDYLGHFAKDEVAEEGHNSGSPRQHEIKRSYDGDTATRGYKVIPGNASQGYVERKTRSVVDAVDSMFGGTVPHGPVGMPTKAPLRQRDRAAKAAAGRGVGHATLRSKHK